jgi:miniconductance mechanosensitive channel
MERLFEFLNQKLVYLGLSDSLSSSLSTIILFFGLLSVIFLVDYIIRRLIIAAFVKIANRSKSNFDDIMVSNNVPRHMAHIVPYILAYKFIPLLFVNSTDLKASIEKIIAVLGIVLLVMGIRSILNSFKSFFKTLKNFKDKPVDSYIQVFMIFVWLTAIFAIVAIFTGVSFVAFASSLGAISAIIILVFRDTILGFVASIQVSINDMVRIGDWITIEKYGADGEVVEISLATVKVQNFDNTITTIPTYALISDSFKNWRGMTESGGRRIKRSLNIRMSSVRHLNPNDLDRLSKVTLISKYITAKTSEIDQANSDTDKSIAINGRHLTNIGVFRKYMETYIENHSAINKDLTIMVRQLQPTTQGLPIEIYAFSSDKRWKNYEYIIADIFDHMIASVRVFDLVIYELEHSN